VSRHQKRIAENRGFDANFGLKFDLVETPQLSPIAAQKSVPYKSTGFTLIELLIAIAIIGILAATVVPLYSDYVQRGKIAGALATLGSLSTRMEKNYLDFRKYDLDGDCAIAIPDSDNFTFSCATAGQDFTWTATSKNGDYEYSVNQTASKETRVFAGKSMSAVDCWMISENGSCF